MKTLLAAALAGLFVVVATPSFAQGAAPATPAKAAAPAAAPAPAATNPQQARMKECNTKAEGKTGDARKEFMSACLSGKEPPKELTAQQQKMKDCNAKAAGKTGDDRKKFMSECLKG